MLSFLMKKIKFLKKMMDVVIFDKQNENFWKKRLLINVTFQVFLLNGVSNSQCLDNWKQHQVCVVSQVFHASCPLQDGTVGPGVSNWRADLNEMYAAANWGKKSQWPEDCWYLM